jgi:hypothetical protein
MTQLKTCRSPKIMIALGVSCLLVATNQVPTLNAKTRPHPAGPDARLIVRRTPTLGNRTFVNLMIDGKGFVTFGYGHNYEISLAPGTHSLSVRATPERKFIQDTWWDTTVELQPGQTHVFTAVWQNDHLILEKAQR